MYFFSGSRISGTSGRRRRCHRWITWGAPDKRAPWQHLASLVSLASHHHKTFTFYMLLTKSPPWLGPVCSKINQQCLSSIKCKGISDSDYIFFTMPFKHIWGLSTTWNKTKHHFELKCTVLKVSGSYVLSVQKVERFPDILSGGYLGDKSGCVEERPPLHTKWILFIPKVRNCFNYE